MMSVQNNEILQALQIGGQKGMNPLFKRYYRPLVVFADSYLHDLPGAEDLVQEQIVKLWSRRAFDHIVPGALSSFLFTVVKNACINLAEKKKLQLMSIAQPHLQIALEEAEGVDDSTVEEIRGALRKLPEKTRNVVECVVLRERMYKEAARELGISVNTVKTLLRQGIKELRKTLSGRRECLLFFLLRRRGVGCE